MTCLKVKVTAFGGYILIDVIDPDQDVEGWVPVGAGKIGSVVVNAHEMVGISEEAIALMREMEIGRDAIGDITWFPHNEGWAFGWFGPVRRAIDLKDAIAARDFNVDAGVAARAYVPIPNHPPLDLMAALASSLSE